VGEESGGDRSLVVRVSASLISIFLPVTLPKNKRQQSLLQRQLQALMSQPEMQCVCVVTVCLYLNIISMYEDVLYIYIYIYVCIYMYIYVYTYAPVSQTDMQCAARNKLQQR